MHFLLAAVNAKFIHPNPAVFSLRASALSRGAKNIDIAEYTINELSEHILADLYRRQPGFIAFSCYIWNIGVIGSLLPELPKLFPGVPVFLGGPEVSFDPEEELLKYPGVTGIMLGEGEETFPELVSEYRRAEAGNRTPELSLIPGLCLREGRTAEREALDMDSLPFFYNEFKDLPGLGPFRNRILYYESSRGCPFRCSYCLSSVEKTLRFRSLRKVLPELQFFLDRKVPQVKFIDRTFNCREEHALPVWEYLLKHDNGITNFHFEISADLLTEGELRVLSAMRPGLVQLETGVQSTNPAALKEVRRTADLGKIMENTERIRQKGNVHQHLDLIAGLPFEGAESFRKSFNDLFRLAPDQLQLGFLKVLKGSFMEKKAADYGLQYRETPPYEVLSTNWLSYGELLILKRVEEMTELFYNSRQFTAVLPLALPLFESPFDFFYALSLFCEQQGFQTLQPSRLLRYELLLRFLEEKDPENSALYREALTYDLVLREKPKTRPPFSRDLSPFRGLLRRLPVGKTEHAEPFFYPVWDPDRCLKGTPSLKELPVLLVFSYEHRDPLSRNASVSFFYPQKDGSISRS